MCICRCEYVNMYMQICMGKYIYVSAYMKHVYENKYA